MKPKALDAVHSSYQKRRQRHPLQLWLVLCPVLQAYHAICALANTPGSVVLKKNDQHSLMYKCTLVGLRMRDSSRYRKARWVSQNPAKMLPDSADTGELLAALPWTKILEVNVAVAQKAPGVTVKKSKLSKFRTVAGQDAEFHSLPPMQRNGQPCAACASSCVQCWRHFGLKLCPFINLSWPYC